MRLSQRAFLLLEATVTAAVIAVGLVFISRGMGTSLKTLSSLQRYDRLLRLAESELNELSAQAQAGIAMPREGTLDGADHDVTWELAVEGVTSKEIPPAIGSVVCDVTLSVHPAQAATPLVRLATIWPKEWTGGCR